MKNESIDMIKNEIDHYCDYLLVLRTACKSILVDFILDDLLKAITDYRPAKLCSVYFKLCLPDQDHFLHRLTDQQIRHEHERRHHHHHHHYHREQHHCEHCCASEKQNFQNFTAPRSRISILVENDGDVMPAGSLAVMDEMSYDTLVSQFLGTDDHEGMEKTMKFLARYELIANMLLCPECQEKQASLVKYKQSPEGYTWRCNKCRRDDPDSETASRFSRSLPSVGRTTASTSAAGWAGHCCGNR
ncbi:hypothetical protein niasHS_016265 [Heterodera schachtii]|uniref:Transposase n=1 Tax=Heterodera schachtii TaxID=97005 RepID=A0ABD2HSM4_HETSC